MTKDTDTFTGLQVRIAAAVAYGRNKEGDVLQIIIYNFDGGIFDVSLLSWDDNVSKVLATIGDTHFGSEYFDNHVIDYLVQWYKKKWTCIPWASWSARSRRPSALCLANSWLTSKSNPLMIDGFSEAP